MDLCRSALRFSSTSPKLSLPLVLALFGSLALTGCPSSHGADSGLADSGLADSGLADGGLQDIGVMRDQEVIDQNVDAGRACPSDILARPANPDGIPVPIILPPDGPCRSDLDCFSGTSCVGASDPHCGICPTPLRECESDANCGGQQVCVESAPSCCGGMDSSCVALCTLDPSVCQGGEICDSASGRCENNACLFLDFACPLNHECDPDATNANSEGCARRSCTADLECDCGFCVTGTCESQLGFCSLPFP